HDRQAASGELARCAWTTAAIAYQVAMVGAREAMLWMYDVADASTRRLSAAAKRARLKLLTVESGAGEALLDQAVDELRFCNARSAFHGSHGGNDEPQRWESHGRRDRTDTELRTGRCGSSIDCRNVRRTARPRFCDVGRATYHGWPGKRRLMFAEETGGRPL